MPSADVSGLDEEDTGSMRDVPDGQRGFASTESNDQLKTVITVDPAIKFEVSVFWELCFTRLVTTGHSLYHSRTHTSHANWCYTVQELKSLLVFLYTGSLDQDGFVPAQRPPAEWNRYLALAQLFDMPMLEQYARNVLAKDLELNPSIG